MCGRFTRQRTVKEIAAVFKVAEIACDLAPSFNIAPSQNLAVIIRDGGLRLVAFKWGLIPSWSRDPSVGNRMINARSETLAEKPSFKRPLENKRCLIVADGFFEWKKDLSRTGKKIPFYFKLKAARLFGFAGLWDSWASPEGHQVNTCTIITTPANELIRPIHHRMPVILPKSSEALWLGSAQKGSSLLSLLQPYPAEEMRAYPVSPLVNSPHHNSPEILKPCPKV